MLYVILLIFLLISGGVLEELRPGPGVQFFESEISVHEKDVETAIFAFNETWDAGMGNYSELFAVIDDETTAHVVNGSEAIVVDPAAPFSNHSIGVQGVFVGRTSLKLKSNDGSIVIKSVPVAVLRPESANGLSQIFTIVLTVLVCLNTFIMGLQLEREVLMKILRAPTGLIIGFICQFGFMPLIASVFSGWGYLLLRQWPNLLFGFFTIGCSPGGGQSNQMTILFDGNINLSISMTFFSNIAALVMMPFWIYTLGAVFYHGSDGHAVTVPFLNIFISLVMLIAPVFVGMVFKHFKPIWAAKIAGLVKWTSLLVILVVLPFGIYANMYLFSLISWRNIVCGMLLPYTGFALAFTVAKILRQNVADCRTIAIETGIQNASIAVVLLQFSLPHPDSDLSLVMPLCVMLMTPLPLLIFLLIKTIYEKCTNKGTQKVADVNEDNVKELKETTPIPDEAEKGKDHKIEEKMEKAVERNGDLEIKFVERKESVHL